MERPSRPSGYDPVLEIFRLQMQLESVENVINMIMYGTLYVHFEKREMVIKEFISSKNDINNAIEICFKEIEADLKNQKVG